MGRVIVVNGPRGIGKTMVVAELRHLVPGTVAINGDQLRAFAPADVRAYLGGAATYRAASALTAAYLSMGAPRVIFDYVLLRAAHVHEFRRDLPEQDARILTLWAPLEVVVARAALPRYEGVQAPHSIGVRATYLEMQHHLAILGEVIDTTSLDPKLTARRIHELCAS